jgi:hypothetical protein
MSSPKIDAATLHNLEIEDLFERNRDLRNARVNLAISVITIFLALWAIILAFISQIIKPESSVEYCGIYSIDDCNSCNVVPINATPNNIRYFSLLQFMFHNNVFNMLIFLGILLTIVLFFIWRIFARYLCTKQGENLEKIKSESNKSRQGKLSETVKKWDLVAFLFVEGLWVVAAIELARIIPGDPFYPVTVLHRLINPLISNYPFLITWVCKYYLDAGSIIFFSLFGGLFLLGIWILVFWRDQFKEGLRKFRHFLTKCK